MIDFPAARRLRDLAGIDLVSCLVNPTTVAETFERLRDPRTAKRAYRAITGRRAFRAATAFVTVATWVIDFYPDPEPNTQSEIHDPKPESGLYHGQQRITDGWQWVHRLLGVINHDGHGLTLRELIHRFEGETYQQFWISCSMTATYLNTKRKSGTPAITVADIHPMHQSRKPKPSGSAQIDHLTAFFGAM